MADELLGASRHLLEGDEIRVAAVLLLALRATPAAAQAYHAEAIEALVDNPRVYLGDSSKHPCRVHRARASLALTPDGEGVCLGLSIDGILLSVAEAAERALVGTEHVVVLREESAECLVSKVGKRVVSMIRLAARYPAVLPPESFGAVLDIMVRLQPDVDIDIPQALGGEQRASDDRPVVRLDPIETPSGLPGLEVSFWVRPAGSGAVWAPGEGPALVFGTTAAGRFCVARNPEAERARAQALVVHLALSQPPDSGPWSYRVTDNDQALELFQAVQALGGEVSVEWPDTARSWSVSRVSELKVRVRRTQDWFGIEGDAKTDGDSVPLSALLETVRQGRRYVRLGPGRFARIATSLKERVQAVDDVVCHGRQGFILGRAAAMHLPALFPEPGALEGDAAWLELCRRIARATELTPSVPVGLKASLRPYQLEGYYWLARLSSWDAGACLADDMGLGKTIQALALMLERAPRGPALVVAPTSVGNNWVDEAQRFAPDLRVILYRGSGRQSVLETLGPYDVLVTSYDIMAIDVEALTAKVFATFVIDEAQAIKNAVTRRARAARQIRAPFRLALTGTPVENHLGELWSLFGVISPGLLGSWEHFRTRYAQPIEQQSDDKRQGSLVRLLRPFLLRRTKAQVAPELPPRTEVVEPVELSRAERVLYNAARRECLELLVERTATPEQSRFIMLAAITRLRRLACHPRLFDENSTVSSSKLRAALELVQSLLREDGRALVFSQFTGHLALLREALDQRSIPYLYLDGATPASERGRLVQRWSKATEPLFLISLKAGGTGLNLTGADMVIHMDPWWNPAVEDQATDRTHRIGQTRPVTVVRLIAQGTIEEAVLGLHAHKRDLARHLLEGADQAARLSAQQLVELIRWGDAEQDVVESQDEVDLGRGEVDRDSAAATKAPEGIGADDSVKQMAEQILAKLAEERRIGRIFDDKTVKAYARTIDRFLSFVEECAGAGSTSRSSGEWFESYIEALRTGALKAPPSELGIARAVKSRIQRLPGTGCHGGLRGHASDSMQ